MKETIRPSTLEDVDAIQVVIKDSDHFDEDMDSVAHIRAKIARDADSILLAEVDGDIVGTIFIVEDGWIALLFRLAVKKEFRKQGIGRRLMEAAESRVRAKGFKEVHGVVSEDKQALQDSYVRMGYKKGKHLYRWIYKGL